MKPSNRIQNKIFLLTVLFAGFLITIGTFPGFADSVTVSSQVVATDIETLDLTTDGKNVGVNVKMTEAANPQQRSVTSNMTTAITPKNEGAITTMGICGDDICDPSLDEDTTSCQTDCLNCGDGLCSSGETCSSCIQDCGECPCGKEICGDTG